MSDDISDPFREPNPFAAQDEPEYSTSGPAVQGDFGMLSHMKPFGICMLVQAGLEILWALVCILIATVLPEFLSKLQQGPNRPPADFKEIMLIAYGSMGVVILGIAILRIFAALKVMQYQGRILAFVSLGSGMLSFLAGCYCLPTAIGLLVWGIIILINEPVKQAFEMRAAGTSKRRINEAFDL